MTKPNVAILGSTSHIAKGLTTHFLEEGEATLHLFTRSADRSRRFLESVGLSTDPTCVVHDNYDDFARLPADVVINCVGVGALPKLHSYSDYFTVTEAYDNMAIEWLRDNPRNALYISFSSGAVYGSGRSAPVDGESANSIAVNHVAPDQYYAIARLNAEAKHRSLHGLRVVDLRVFSYFSRYIDLTDGYFITDVLDCVLNSKVLKTNGVNIVRDYVHPKDLFALVKKCMEADRVNAAFDVGSSKPVEKQEILNYFSSKYGLKYEVVDSLDHFSPTGGKNVYWSKYAEESRELGYSPRFSSMDAIREEAGFILEHSSELTTGSRLK